MNLARIPSLMVCVLPLCLLPFVACNGSFDESAESADPGEGSVGIAAQAATMAGFPMPSAASEGLPNPASYTSGDGIVTDLVTGLSWQQGHTSGLTRDGAAAYCAGLTLGGHSDFRVPTRIELISIVDSTEHTPATDPTYFPDTPDGYYWTSTPMVFFPSNAFKVSGAEGNTSYGGAGLNKVRCVRSPVAPPVSQLVIQGNGLVQDTGTGLIWQREVGAQTFTASEAESYCGTSGDHTLLGSGWRLPSMKELQTIVDDSRTFPAIDEGAFPNTPTDVAYWTSTQVSWQQPGNAWFVTFEIGQSNHGAASSAYHARCVHDTTIQGIESFSFAPENLKVDKVGNGDHTMMPDQYKDGVFQAVVTGAIVNVAISTTDATGTECALTQQNDTIVDAAPIVPGMAACPQYTEGGQSYVLGVSLDGGATLWNGPTLGAFTPLAYGIYSLKLYGEGPKPTALSSTHYGNGTSTWTLRVQFADGTVAVSPPVQAPHYGN